MSAVRGEQIDRHGRSDADDAKIPARLLMMGADQRDPTVDAQPPGFHITIDYARRRGSGADESGRTAVLRAAAASRILRSMVGPATLHT